MPAIGVSQAPARIIVFGEKQGGVRAIACVSTEDFVYRPQQIAERRPQQLTMDPKVSLEIRHQQRGGDAFAGNVARDEPETPVANVKEIEVVAADRAGLATGASVVKRDDRREGLGKQPRLDLLCDIEFLRGAALCLF